MERNPFVSHQFTKNEWNVQQIYASRGVNIFVHEYGRRDVMWKRSIGFHFLTPKGKRDHALRKCAWEGTSGLAVKRANWKRKPRMKRLWHLRWILEFSTIFSKTCDWGTILFYFCCRYKQLVNLIWTFSIHRSFSSTLNKSEKPSYWEHSQNSISDPGPLNM